ncbi:hypothetical protein EHE19_018100 [Ruminiclostridium herbifermentans]|uniref:Lipoprotein n=1 Tax=Ruminiclostridium herbifermentans TaxID=2488810 RepID=A0A4V6EMT9_9FIRM|nr:hypothetical protein [Ruminiclostridium herbifermentans]QNU66727.1 hypothetical protein EHE19_018100 [Ruminiclostridium herbifermentans]
MKQIINLLILLSVFSLTLSGCGSTAKQQAVTNTTQQVQKVVKDTPHQVGQKGTMSTSVNGFFFDKSFEKADIVAEVTIQEWLGEIDSEDILETTIFRVSLEKIFKNNVDKNLKEVNLFQTGNSKRTVENSPLFKNGDRLLLYLKKTELEGYKNTYYILGEQTGIFRIVNTDKQDYVIKQVGDCPQLSDAKVTGNTDRIKNTLTKSYSVEFSNLDKIGMPETYNLATVEKLINEQKDK